MTTCPICSRRVESHTSHYICQNCGCEFAIYKAARHKNLWQSTMDKFDKVRALAEEQAEVERTDPFTCKVCGKVVPIKDYNPYIYKAFRQIKTCRPCHWSRRMMNVLKCPICKRMMPPTTEVQYITDVPYVTDITKNNLGLFHQTVCLSCGTKVIIPAKTMNCYDSY